MILTIAKKVLATEGLGQIASEVRRQARFVVGSAGVRVTLIGKGAHMSNYESEIERHAGVDMVPVGESFDWNPGPDDGAPILRSDFNLKMPNPVATPCTD